MSKKVKAVGVFEQRQDVAAVIQELRNYNYPLDRVMVLAKEGDEKKPIAGMDVCDRDDIPKDANLSGQHNLKDAATSAIAGGAFGGVAGLLAGLTSLAIPGIGPVAFFGAEATALASSLSTGALGVAAGGFVGALASLGIPRKQAKVYNEDIKQGKYLLLICGRQYDTMRAESILKRMDRSGTNWSLYEDAINR
ncbi:MAG: hypothetical protein ACLFV6_11680 [Spirulinaceae cyanobacterium]